MYAPEGTTDSRGQAHRPEAVMRWGTVVFGFGAVRCGALGCGGVCWGGVRWGAVGCSGVGVACGVLVCRRIDIKLL